jgi:hypothetical protein
MARVPRARSRVFSFPGGYQETYFGDTLASAVRPSARNFTSTCNDLIGSPVSDGSFNSNQYKGTYPNINGLCQGTNRTADNHTVYGAFTYTTLPLALSGMTVLTAPSGWLLDLVAGTNPSRPIIGIPIWAQNIAQLPKMLKSLGDLIRSPSNALKPKGFAGEYLGVQFGWLPLIEDLTKLLDFQKYVMKRNKELAQLYSGKGLRRRLKFNDDTVTNGYSVNSSIYPTGSCAAKSSLTVKRRNWGTIHWYPTTPPPFHPDDLSQNQFVSRVVLGATPEGLSKGLWDVIPWTWLIGWFTNLGKYTLAHSWTVPATHGAGCLMREAVGTWSAGDIPLTLATGNLSHRGQLTRTIKTRLVSSTVTVGVNMPYLDMFRLSILGALFTQRFVR